MPKDKIASEPTTGWGGQCKPYSIAALEWLSYQEHVDKVHIQHARNGGEVSIRCRSKRIFPDGMDAVKSVTYQFHGCYWHGCPTHHPNHHTPHDKLAGLTMDQKYQATLCDEDLLCQAQAIPERCLTGTWWSPEVQEAINHGYKIQQVHEIWHFPRQSADLFQSYVTAFLKIKQEASGWPDWVGDDPQKRAEYVANYRAKEGVELDPENIAKTPGHRSLAKLMLNSFWGKYGQQSNKTQVAVFSSPADFYKLLLDDTKIIKNLQVVTSEMVEVSSQNIDDADPVQININIFVACFTTCRALLKLYREGLSPLEPKQVLYFDTDSIIYFRKPDQPGLALGDYLGEFTSELDAGDTIVEFASAGPKNYAYMTKMGVVECKVRGFSLNVRGQAQLNFNTLKKKRDRRSHSTRQTTPRDSSVESQ